MIEAFNVIAAAGARCRYDAFAILALIQAFSFPQIRVDAGVLKLVDSFDHQTGPQKRQIVASPSCRPPLSFSSCAFSAGTRSSNMEARYG